MTIKTSYVVLAAALDAAAEAAAGKNASNPMFAAMSLSASAEARKLRLATFNGAIAGHAVIAVDCDADLAIYVNAETFQKVVKATASKKSEIKLSLGKDGKLLVQSGTSKTTLAVVDAELPAVPSEGLAARFTVAGSAWRSLTRVAPFVATDDSKPALKSIYFTVMSNGGQTFVGAMASDTAAVGSMVVPAGAGEAGAKISLPFEFVRVVSSQAADGDNVQVLDAGAGRYVVRITSADGKAVAYAGATLAETFPAEAILKLHKQAQSNAATWSAPKTELAAAARQAQAVGSVAMFLSSNGSVRAASRQTDYGQAKVVLADAQASGPDAQVWLGTGYMEKMIAALSGEVVKVKMETGKPIVLFDDGQGFSALIARLADPETVSFDDDEEVVPVELPGIVELADAIPVGEA